MIAPNVQILSPISQVHRPLVLLGAVDGFINVLADACPRPCLLERLAAAQLGPGGVTLLTDKRVPSHIYAHTHAHTYTRTVIVAEYGAIFYNISSSTGANMKIGCLERVVFMLPQLPIYLKSRQNTHTNSKPSTGGLKRKLCCISEGDALFSLDGGVVDIMERNGCLTDRAVWMFSIQKHGHFILSLFKQKQQVLDGQPGCIHKTH